MPSSSGETKSLGLAVMCLIATPSVCPAVGLPSLGSLSALQIPSGLKLVVVCGHSSRLAADAASKDVLALLKWDNRSKHSVC